LVVHQLGQVAMTLMLSLPWCGDSRRWCLRTHLPARCQSRSSRLSLRFAARASAGVFISDWGRASTLRPDLAQVVEVGPVFFQAHDGHACRAEDYQPRSRRGALGIQTVTSQ